LKQIQELRYEHAHPRVRRRMEALWLKSQGLEHQEICRLAGLSSNTLRTYLRLFQAGGIKKLTELNFYAPVSELERHRYQLETYFREHPPATLNEAAAKIEELTGLKRSPSAVGRFLNALGMAPRRVGTIPSKADPEKQEHFRVNELEPRLEQARQGKRAIFLSMLLTSCWVPFSGFCGHFPVSL
jgi:transposase